MDVTLVFSPYEVDRRITRLVLLYCAALPAVCWCVYTALCWVGAMRSLAICAITALCFEAGCRAKSIMPESVAMLPLPENTISTVALLAVIWLPSCSGYGGLFWSWCVTIAYVGHGMYNALGRRERAIAAYRRREGQ